MHRFWRSLVALLLVFGCCVGFCLDVSAAEVSSTTWPSQPNITVAVGSTGTAVFTARYTIDPVGGSEVDGTLIPYRLYTFVPGIKVSSISHLNANGASVAQDSGIKTNVSFAVSSVSSSIGGVVISEGSLSTVSFYLTSAQTEKFYIDLSGVMSVSITKGFGAGDKVAKVRVFVGFNGVPLQDTGQDVPHQADNVLDAVLDQTEQDKQMHQETMDKINEITDFTGDQQSDLDTSLGSAGTDLESKLGVLSFADSVMSDFIGVFADDPGPAQLTLPGFKIEVDGEQHEVWADTPYQLSSLEESFGPLLTAVRFGMVVLVYAALISYLGRVLDALLHGSDVKEE